MAEIAYAVPSGTTYRPGARVGYARPGLQVTQFPTGPYLSRDLLGHNLRTYELTPSIFDGSSTDQLEAWEAFLYHTNGGADPFWVEEPISQEHRGIVAGPPLDGSQKTFTIPVRNFSVSNGYMDVGGYARWIQTSFLKGRANLIPLDAEAQPESTTYFPTLNGATAGTQQNVTNAPLGTTVLTMTPNGTTANPAILFGLPASYATTYAPVVAGDTYTATIWCQCRNTRDGRARLWWYDSGGTYLSTSDGATTECTAMEWTTLTTGLVTAPASAAYARIGLQEWEATPNTYVWWVSAWTLAPGSLDVWHLPSRAPSVLVMSTAYSATGHGRVLLTGTGYRMTRCVGSPGMSWTLDGRGSASVRSIIATEALEF